MKIEEREEDGFSILDMHGRLLIGDGTELLREKFNALDEAGKTRIALNLADVSYVDSAGLGEIVRCYTTVSRKDGQFKLLNPNKRVRELLKITRLDTFFEEDAS